MMRIGLAGLDPTRSCPQLDILPPKRCGDRRVGHAVAGADPRKRSACGVERHGFTDLLLGKALAANGDATLTEHRCNPGLGDAVAVTDLSGSFTRFVSLHYVRDV
jgi:hypothetical protein